MSGSFLMAEFLGSDGRTQAKMCRKMADEADAFVAATTDPELRASYLELKRQWRLLAEEVEHLATLSAIAS
jgi:hypothetical protein